MVGAATAGVVVLAVAAVLGLASVFGISGAATAEVATTLVALGLIAVAIGVVLSVFVAAIGWLTGIPE